MRQEQALSSFPRPSCPFSAFVCACARAYVREGGAPPLAQYNATLALRFFACPKGEILRFKHSATIASATKRRCRQHVVPMVLLLPVSVLKQKPFPAAPKRCTTQAKETCAPKRPGCGSTNFPRCDKVCADSRHFFTRSAACGALVKEGSGPIEGVVVVKGFAPVVPRAGCRVSTVLAQDHFYSDLCCLPSTCQTQASSMEMID